MINGKTKDGFEYILSDAALDNMELVDALEELDEGNTLAAAKVISLLLGKEQKKAFYKFYRTESGNVPVEKACTVLKEIFEGAEETKNS